MDEKWKQKIFWICIIIFIHAMAAGALSLSFGQDKPVLNEPPIEIPEGFINYGCFNLGIDASDPGRLIINVMADEQLTKKRGEPANNLPGARDNIRQKSWDNLQDYVAKFMEDIFYDPDITGLTGFYVSDYQIVFFKAPLQRYTKIYEKIADVLLENLRECRNEPGGDPVKKK